MAASIVIIVVSLALAVYWLRYTCLLLLEERKVEDATAFPLFSFGIVRDQARAGVCAPSLRTALDRDYATFDSLLPRIKPGSHFWLTGQMVHAFTTGDENARRATEAMIRKARDLEFATVGATVWLLCRGPAGWPRET